MLRTLAYAAAIALSLLVTPASAQFAAPMLPTGGGGLTVGGPISGTCPNGDVLYSNNGALGCEVVAGTGTVTNVSWTGGIVSIANPTTVPAFTIAGTSGGIPYFASGSTWASSAALTAGEIVLGGGAGAAPTALAFGTANQCLTTNAGATALAWASCGGGSSTLTVGSTATSGGAAGQLMYDTGSVLTESASLVFSGGLLDIGASGTLGGVKMGNASTGTVTLQPVTGALGTVTASLPANTGTIAELNLAQTFTATQTIGTGNQLILPAGSATNPSLVSSTDQTGIYFTSNALRFAVAGAAGAVLQASTLSISPLVFSLGFGTWTMSSPTGNVIHLGPTDNTTATAQTLGVMNVVGGTSNTAGANWTVTGSAGTGTGVGGDIILKVAKAGSTGSSQNAETEAFRIAAATALPQWPSSSTGAGTETFTNSPCTGLTTEQWMPVQITGQTGTWFVPACQ